MPYQGIETTLRTLLRSSNPAATDLLVIALDSEEPALRAGAARAIALRHDRVGHRALIERLHRLPADTQGALRDVPRDGPLTASLIGMIRADLPRLSRRAVQVAADWGIVDVLTAAVESAQWPTDFADAIATDVLRLAKKLEQAIRHYDPSDAAQAETRPVDPAFARRAALNALLKSLNLEGSRRPPQLLDALLLLTPGDEPGLWTALHDETHPAHEELNSALQTSQCRGALGVLAQAIRDPRSPRRVLRLATERCDRAGLEKLLGLLGSPLGVRVRESCRRIEGFAWLEPTRVGVLALLSGPAQATALEIAAASSAKPRRLVEAILVVLQSEAPEARLSACRAIEALPSHLAIEPLQQALESGETAVTAQAAKLLRPKDFPDATGRLIRLLDDPDRGVQAVAQQALRELSFATFRDHLHEMTEDQQSRVGRLISKADPLASATLKAELGSGAASRRVEALRLLELMGVASELVGPLTQSLLTDTDTGVRAEAARLLGGVESTPMVTAALKQCLDDRSSAVRSAVESSLGRLGVVIRYEPGNVS